MLDALQRSGAEFAFLHQESQVASGQLTGDLDLVIGEDPAELLFGMQHFLEPIDARPVLLWINDIGGNAVAFISDMQARAAVQLDLLYDPKGVGKTGVRGAAAAKDAVLGTRWPRVPRLVELLYLIRKRSWKQQLEELESLIHALERYSLDEIGISLDRYFSNQAARELLTLLDTFPVVRPGASSLVSTARHALRLSARLREPPGFWVHVHGHGARDSAAALVDAFGRFLPYVDYVCYSPSHGPRARAYLRSVMPIRLRPGLAASWSGESSALYRPDLVVPAARLMGGPGPVVQAMFERVQERLRRSIG